IASQSDFRVFTSVVQSGGLVRALAAPGLAGYSRSQIAELEGIAKEAGAKGLATIAVEADGSLRSSITQFFSEDQLAALVEKVGAQPGDLILLVADEPAIANEALSELRTELGRRLQLTDPNELAFAWIVDFPLFEWNADEERWDPSHHMFTAPKPEHVALLDSDPAAVQSQQYDLVCNGYEVAGGSIRIHERGGQGKSFELIGLAIEGARGRCGQLPGAVGAG